MIVMYEHNLPTPLTPLLGRDQPYRVAAVHLALGDKDQAIGWLNKDFEEMDNWMNQLKVDPLMDPLRSHPRFQELMREINFRE